MSALDALGLVGSTVGEIRFDACIDDAGFGTIYRGTHLGKGEPMAIKCLRLSRLARLTERMRASIVARFEEETAILTNLSQGTHDIVHCYASGQVFAPTTGERVPYIVLEWLEGRSLSADLAERRERGLGGRSLPETLDLVESAALAIAHAHTKGIIHRDIKPSNLMLTRTRGGLRLKVLDFGLAKILSGGPGSRTNIATADGVHLVSVGYCAPEQLSASVGEVGPWTDIYSLSLVMLEVMRGEKIPHPTSAALRPSSFGIAVPAAVDDLFARALSQSPLERPTNASIFWSALRELTRQSQPPVADASALAATTFDPEGAAILANVRPPVDPGLRPAAPSNPFTGTMLMMNAPSGALHLLSPQHAPGPRVPAQSAPAISMLHEATTEPLAPKVHVPPIGHAPPAMPHGGTVGLAPPRSPLAASLGGPGLRSPVAHVPNAPPASVMPPGPAMPPFAPIPAGPPVPRPSPPIAHEPGPGALSTTSEPPSAVPSRRAWPFVLVIVLVLVGLGSAAAYLYAR